MDLSSHSGSSFVLALLVGALSFLGTFMLFTNEGRAVVSRVQTHLQAETSQGVAVAGVAVRVLGTFFAK